MLNAERGLRAEDHSTWAEAAVARGSAGPAARVCQVAPGPGRTAAAASASGSICLVDERAGGIVRRWRGHDAEPTSVAAAGDSALVTAAADGSVMLWDLRSQADASAPACGATGALHRWQLQQASGGLSVLEGQAVCFSGHQLGVLGLQPPFGSSFQAVRRRGPPQKAQPREAAIAGIGVLPHSQLLLLGFEDGNVRVCM
mmetsp:Transcript_18990/g.45352  ORF Transcript_18990/g.45352 Transcript_18990/m.45352 type:complete len:200 (+) Transcript_18990:143-742(+)